MKNLKIRFFIVLFAAILMLAGCSGRSNGFVSTSGLNEETGASGQTSAETASADHQEPPHQIVFHSWDDYNTFCSITEKTDEEIAVYLAQNNFDMNGINNREDVQNVKTTLDNWYSVRLKTDDLSLCSISYNVDRQFVDISYVKGDNYVKGSISTDYDDLFIISSESCNAGLLKSIEELYEEEEFMEIDGVKFHKKKTVDYMFAGIINEDCVIAIMYHGKNLQSVPELLCKSFEFALIKDLRKELK